MKKQQNAQTKMITTTRKIALYPEVSDNKYWITKFNNWVSEKEQTYNDFIKDLENKKSKAKTKKEKEYCGNKIEELTKGLTQIKDYKETGVITEKLKNDYTYDFCRKASKAEAYHKNLIISHVFTKMIENGYDSLFSEEARDLFKEKFNEGVRISGDGLGSLVDNPLKGYGVSWSKALNSALKDDIKKGLLKGKCSVKSFKDDSPFSICKEILGFETEYDIDDLAEKIKEKNTNLYLNLGSHGKPTLLRFKLNLGANPKNKDELTSTIYKIFSGEYTYGGSSIQVKNNKIFLNLTVQFEAENYDLDENTVVGIDLGMAHALVGALNNDEYKSIVIGNPHELEKIRQGVINQRRNLQKDLTIQKGGHGRRKKLKALERYKKRERNAVKTFNHKVSREIINFALKNKAKYIQMEDLSNFSKKADSKKYVLRNWSYYQLQTMIEYKAEKVGIIVKKINPAYTSQTCSFCGNVDEKARVSQSQYICTNPECLSHKKYNFFNADFNAARNIALYKE